jgi:predicted metalloprotease with PDZ domain
MNREDLELESGSQNSRSQNSGSQNPVAYRTKSTSEASHSGSIAPSLQLHYQVAMPKPESHLFEVTLRVSGLAQLDTATLDLKMPVWTPGSYLVREYARHLQNFTAVAHPEGTEAEAVPLKWHKQGKNHWQIQTQGYATVTLHYQIYAYELSVRTNHLDSSHGYFNGAALFFYVPGHEKTPLTVTIVPPRLTWEVSTALPPVAGQPHTFLAADFDTLVDSPFEIGSHPVYTFEVQGKPHQLAVWGTGNLDPERLIADIQKLIHCEAEIFCGLPYDRYLFLLHLSAQGFGGLEHKDSCSLIYQRFGFRRPEKYHRLIQLVAHEFFHLWNVKRIRPKGLEIFDYEQENYTPSLWFSEGTTSYYDLAIPYRAGIYDTAAYLSALSKEISRYLTTPGRNVQPLSESSFDAWVKLYRPDANSPNAQISYYLKGEMVSLLLDLLIRARHGNHRSLDDVLRQLWQQFGKPEIGFTPEQLQQTIETIAETQLSHFFDRYLHSTEELPFDDFLAPFGLRLQPGGTEAEPPFLGLNLKTEAGRDVVKFVESGSPAQKAGIAPGDELLAIEGIRVSADQLSERLRDFRSGDTVQLTFFHQDALQIQSVRLGTPRPLHYQIVPVAQPSLQQEQNFLGWLGAPLAKIM